MRVLYYVGRQCVGGGIPAFIMQLSDIDKL